MLPVQLNASAAAQFPSLPDDLMALFKADAEHDWNGLGSSTIKRLKLGRMGFTIGVGAEAQTIPFDQLVGVCIATAQYNHCTWYQRSYQPGQEPEAPDLVWIQKVEGQFPDALPKKFHQKVVKDGSERWDFKIQRRSVWAFMHPDGKGGLMLDLDNPVVFDISSMNLFGKSFPDQNMYKWTGLISLCKRMSVGGIVVTPAMFPIRIFPDGKVSNASVVVFQPMMCNDNKSIQFLDGATIRAVREKRMSPEVQDMLNVVEKLTFDGADAPMPTPQPIQPQPIQPQQTVPTPAAQQTIVQAAQPDPQPQAYAKPQAAPQPTDMASLLAQAQAALAGTVSAPQPNAAPASANAADAIAALMAQASR